MEEIRNMFLKLQSDVNETKTSLKEMENSITTNITMNMQEMFGNLQMKLQDLELKNQAQERRLDVIERTQRQRNVVIFGLEEEERSYNDLSSKIMYVINEIMQIKCETYEIQAIRRIGKKGEKIRPVVLTLTTLGRKIEIQKNWKTLKNTKYSISEDFPPKILEIRKALYEQAKKEKENGNRVIIKYDKLVILPPYTNEPTMHNVQTSIRKRTLARTPPQVFQPHKNKEIHNVNQQQSKKNKISSYWTPSSHYTSTATAAADKENNQ